jgi:L-fuconate dehydratase
VADADAEATVRAALAAGLTYLDTAPHYGLGLAERRLGRVLAGLPRDGFVVSTKVGRLLRPLAPGETADPEGFVGAPPGKRVWDLSREGVRRSLEESLERLGLDRVDIVLLHDPDDHEREAYEQAFPALAEPLWKLLARFGPWWIEEPTSPDDVLGHATIAKAIAPIRVVTGEHTHNRVMFKQLLQAGAVAAVQVDACRLAGVNEVVAVLLLAARFGVPVCPHAGGVGLCELVVHLSAFDYLAASGSLDERMIEYVDHLHEHFVEPVRVTGGRYHLPQAPGYGAMTRRALDQYRFPDGPEWAGF